MTQMTTRLGAAALATLLGSGAALADLSAEAVWQNWQDDLAAWGASLEAGETTREDGRLVAHDVTYAVDERGLRLSGAIAQITFAETDDGAVRVTFSPDIPVAVAFTDAFGDGGELDLTLRHEAFEIRASGRPGAMRYDYSAAEMALGLDDFRGPEAENYDVELEVTLADVSAEEVHGGAQAGTYDAMAAIGRLDVAARFVDRDGGNATILDWSAEDAGMAYSAEQTGAMAAGGAEEALAAGFEVEAATGHNGSRYTLEVTEDGETRRIEGASAEGSIGLGLDAGGLSYDATARDLRLSVDGSDVPMGGGAFEMETFSFESRLPVVAADTPQDFATMIRIDGLELGEEVWARFDPQGALPREPAQLMLDITGRANWESNIIDRAAGGPRALMTQPPAQLGDLHALDLNALSVTLLGTELTGDGGFTFDNEDVTTFGGVPRPEGRLNLRLQGAEATIDRLIDSGVISQQDAMGAMMMMSMFARPGEEDDMMQTTIEIDAQGGVIANGQRLR